MIWSKESGPMDRPGIIIKLVFLITLFLLDLVSPTEGNTHCYCNSPRCASSSYMCLSKYGCYSEWVDSGDITRTRMHGCVDDIPMLDRCFAAKQMAFKRSNQSLHKTNNDEIIPPQSLACCDDDMCNYARNNEDDSRELGGNDDVNPSDFDSLTSSAVWFRAAVIAVPVAGFCILVLLAMLASHLLSNDMNKQAFSKLHDGHTSSGPRKSHRHYPYHQHCHSMKQKSITRSAESRTSHGAYGEDDTDTQLQGACKVVFNESNFRTTPSLIKNNPCTPNCYTYLPTRSLNMQNNRLVGVGPKHNIDVV